MNNNQQQKYLIEIAVNPQQLLQAYKDNTGQDADTEDIQDIIFQECQWLQDSSIFVTRVRKA